jgi:hypothetical protein
MPTRKISSNKLGSRFRKFKLNFPQKIEVKFTYKGRYWAIVKEPEQTQAQRLVARMRERLKNRPINYEGMEEEDIKKLVNSMNFTDI